MWCGVGIVNLDARWAPNPFFFFFSPACLCLWPHRRRCMPASKARRAAWHATRHSPITPRGCSRYALLSCERADGGCSCIASPTWSSARARCSTALSRASPPKASEPCSIPTDTEFGCGLDRALCTLHQSILRTRVAAPSCALPIACVPFCLRFRAPSVTAAAVILAT